MFKSGYMEVCGNRSWRWVMSDYLLMYFYSKNNQMHQCLKFILFYFAVTLYMFRTVFPSIIRISRLYIQQQAFVKQILLSACCTYSNRHLSNRYCCLLAVHTATDICQTDNAVCWLASRQQYLFDKCLLLYV